jgi:hypothetical protein
VGGFGVVPLGFATDAPPCGRGVSLYRCKAGILFEKETPFYFTIFRRFCEFLHITREKKEGLRNSGPLF